MRIAIDFDETLTADAALWRGFIELCIAGGHTLVCVTARRDTDANRDIIAEWMESHGMLMPVYFTGLGSKVDYMQRRNCKVDIWIDDDPRKCALGH